MVHKAMSFYAKNQRLSCLPYANIQKNFFSFLCTPPQTKADVCLSAVRCFLKKKSCSSSKSRPRTSDDGWTRRFRWNAVPPFLSNDRMRTLLRDGRRITHARCLETSKKLFFLQLPCNYFRLKPKDSFLILPTV